MRLLWMPMSRRSSAIAPGWTERLPQLGELGEVRQHLNFLVCVTPRRGDAGDPRRELCGGGRFCAEGLRLGRLTFGDQVEGVYGLQMFSIRREQGRLAEVAPIVKHH